jgi:Lar family restriction alleviation protein
MNDNDLKSCPFCGTDSAYVGYEEDNQSYCVWCAKCLARVEEFTSEESAIKAWNTRKENQ